MIYPCPVKIDCPGTDFPIENYSSEDPEIARFCCVQSYVGTPPLGCGPVPGATVKACSPVSFQDACLDALNAAQAIVEAEFAAEGCPQPRFCNTAQTCTITCPDGSSTTFTVEAGRICADSQEAADIAAQSYGCQRARENQICLGDLPSFCCLDAAYNGIITASGLGLSPAPLENFWEIFGLLPTGLTFHGGYLAANQALITGVPTDSVPQTFTVKVTAQNGQYGIRTYTLGATSIDWSGASPAFSPLPGGVIGTPYSVDILFPATLPSPALWSVAAGALPPGLSLNPVTGLISGTPTVAGTFAFTLGLFSA